MLRHRLSKRERQSAAPTNSRSIGRIQPAGWNDAHSGEMSTGIRILTNQQGAGYIRSDRFGVPHCGGQGDMPLSSSRLMDFHEVRPGYGGTRVGREFASPDPDTKNKCYTQH
jgi:hypothetical protein